MPFGPLELIVVLVIVLLLFGAKRLPELGRSLGGGMREFKDSVTSKDSDPPQVEARRESPVEPTATQPQAQPVDAPASDPLAKPASPPSNDAD